MPTNVNGFSAGNGGYLLEVVSGNANAGGAGAGGSAGVIGGASSGGSSSSSWLAIVVRVQQVQSQMVGSHW